MVLPEAIDPHSSAVLSRHWFAWPGATFAYELLRIQEAMTGGKLMLVVKEKLQKIYGKEQTRLFLDLEKLVDNFMALEPKNWVSE